MDKIIIRKGDRYDLQCGRFGVYIYDKFQQRDVDMLEIWQYLNEQNIEGRDLNRHEEPKTELSKDDLFLIQYHQKMKERRDEYDV